MPSEPTEANGTGRLGEIATSIVGSAAILALFFALAVALQHLGFGAPMVYDSQEWIANRAPVYQSGDLADIVSITQVRPLFMLSLYLNYAWAGLDTSAFRVINALILAAAGLALFRLLECALCASRPDAGNEGSDRLIVAFCVATLFVAHPVQSFVTLYIWQRGAILACLFYFAALAVYLAARSGRFTRPGVGYVITAVLFLLGMMSKENTATLPVMMALAEVTFFRTNFRALVKRVMVIGLITAPPFALYQVVTLYFHAGRSIVAKGILARMAEHYAEGGLEPWQVVMIAFRVIWEYAFSVLAPGPTGLPLVKAMVVSQSLLAPPSSLLALLGIVFLLIVGVALIRNRPLSAFGIFFFATTLLPESLLIPQYLYFGHRAILPAAGIAMILADLGLAWIGKYRSRYTSRGVRIVFVCSVTIAFCYLAAVTSMQARVWSVPVLFWQDEIAKSPPYGPHVEKKPYLDMLLNLGGALSDVGLWSQAADCYARTLEIQPGLALGHNNLGLALDALGNSEAAEKHFRKAIEIQPDLADAHNNLGLILLRSGRTREAVERFQEALKARPDFATAHSNLGIIYLNAGEPGEAVRHFREAVKLNPSIAEAHNNLGVAYVKSGRTREAAREFQEAVRLAPGFTKAIQNLQQAEAQLEKASPHNAPRRALKQEPPR